MKRLKRFIENIIIYKSVEGFLFSFILFSVLKNLCDFYNFNTYISLLTLIFPLFFLYRNKRFFNKKKVINIIERHIPHDYSIHNIFIDNKRNDKYRFSKELVEAERLRNIKYLSNHRFRISYSNLIFLIFVSILLSFSMSLSSEYRSIEKIPFIYEVIPGNTEVFFDTDMEFHLHSNKDEIFNVNILKADDSISFELKDNGFDYRLTDNIRYFFSSPSFRTDTYSVEVIYPLINTGIKWEIKYPDYASNILKKTEGNNIQCPKGSELNAIFSFNNKIEIFRLENNNKDNNNQVIINNDSNSITIFMKNSQEYRFYAEDIYNQSCFVDIAVNELTDKPPVVTVIIPTETDILLENPFIPMRFTAEDDFGLTESGIEIIYNDNTEFKQKISDYNSISVIEEKTLAVKKNGVFQIFVKDRKHKTISQKYSFRILDDMDVVKEAYNSAKKTDEDIKEISENIKTQNEKISELSQKLLSSGEITQKDSIEAEKLMDDLNTLYERSSEVLNELDKTEDFLKKQSAFSELFEKIERLRNTIKEMMSENIRNTMQELAKISQNQKMSFDSWKSFADNTDIEKMTKSIEMSLKLFDKAKKDQQHAAMIELLEYIRDNTNKAVIMLQNIVNADFGILKGIKINIEDIRQNFLYVQEFFDKNKVILSISQDYAVFSDNVFSDRIKAVETGKKIVRDIDEFLKNEKKSFEDRKNAEKEALAEKLEIIYRYLYSSLKIVNTINYGYQSGKDIYSFSEDLALIRKNIEKTTDIFEQVIKDSFILDSTKIKELIDVYVYVENIWERGKEGSRIDSYIAFTEKKTFFFGIIYS